MRNLHPPGALVLALIVAGESQAQTILSLPPPGKSLTSIGGMKGGDDRHGGKARFSVFLSGSFASGYFAPYPFFPPVGNAVTVITIYGPASPVVGNSPTPRELQLLRDLDLMPREPPDQPAEPPRPGIRRIGPNNRVPVPPPAPAPMPPPHAPLVVPLPNRERPADNAKGEYDRLVTLGKDAFAGQQYGRAAERFRQAIGVMDDATAHFLLAQAEFALSKYFDAVDAIDEGLKLDPKWPASAFRPQILYGLNGEEYTEQLQRLQSALTHHPDDPILLFLFAYQLWFDGRRSEALPLFQRAAAVAPDKAAIEKFLQAKP